MTPEAITVFGSITIDDLVFADSSTRWAVPGGEMLRIPLWEVQFGAPTRELLHRSGPTILGRFSAAGSSWRAAVPRHPH